MWIWTSAVFGFTMAGVQIPFFPAWWNVTSFIICFIIGCFGVKMGIEQERLNKRIKRLKKEIKEREEMV